MRKNKRFIYLISPNKINQGKFFIELANVLSSKKILFFQLRLKNTSFIKRLSIGKKVRKICKKYNVKLIINDDPLLTRKINADGCHLGQSDMSLSKARKILNKKIIGVTCHGSLDLVKKAINEGADYIALGSFFRSKTKKNTLKTNFQIIRHAKRISDVPLVCIGGIDDKNYKKLLLHKPNFLAISNYIWNNSNLSPLKALEKIKL